MSKKSFVDPEKQGSSIVNLVCFTAGRLNEDLRKSMRIGSIEEANPPDFLQNYYAILEKEYHFAHTLVRTDYHFTYIDEAEELTRFFFGRELADQVKEKNRVHLPE